LFSKTKPGTAGYGKTGQEEQIYQICQKFNKLMTSFAERLL